MTQPTRLWLMRLTGAALLLTNIVYCSCAQTGDPERGGFAAAVKERGGIRDGVGSNPRPVVKSQLSGRMSGRTHFVVLEQPSAVTQLRRGRVFETAKYVRHLEGVQAVLAPRVEAVGARVIGRVTRLANALLVVAPPEVLDRLRRLDGVRRVEAVPLDRRTTHESVELVGASTLWQLPFDLIGRGVRVGVVDSGIDYTHAGFGGSGLAADYQSNDPTFIEPGTFPTARVVGGYDFAGDAYDSGDPNFDVPQPDEDPLDCPRPASSGHGSHVAGILASGGVTSDGSAYTGPYNMSLDPAAFTIMPGVAPAAELYALKVFGCASGSTTSLASVALEWAADPNGDGLFDDRLDVVNLSLGSKLGLGTTRKTVVENLAFLGTVITASSGNTDSDVKRVRPFFLVDNPAVVHPVIAVANSYKTVVSFRSLEITGAALGPYPVAEGRDNPPLETTGTVSGPLVRPTDRDGCDPFANASDFPGAVALIDRGGCSFDTKFANAESAGAVAAVVVDYSGHDVPWQMTSITAALPGGMIRTPHGDELHAALDSGAELAATLDANVWYPATIGPNYIRHNSCRGPSAWDGLLKPDLAAPGASIFSVASGLGFEGVNKSGTSMSAPHVAGAAALLLEADSSLSPLAIKARLMSTAIPTVDLTGARFPASLAGAGRIQVDEALRTAAYLVTQDATGNPSPRVSISYGAHVTDAPFELERTVQVVNTSGSPITYQVAIDPGRALPGTQVTATPASVTVPAGGTETIEVHLAVDPAALGPPTRDNVTPPVGFQDMGRHFLVECDGLLQLTPTNPATQVTLTLPYHAVLRAAGHRRADTPRGCPPSQDPSIIGVGFTGSAVIDASPVTSAFVNLPGAEAAPLLALGVSHNLAAVDADPSIPPTLYFGVATALEWLLPSRRNRSAAGLHIDLTGNGDPDYSVVMDSETESGDNDFGNADIYTVRIYPYGDSASEDYTPARVNVLDPRVLNTHAHLNSVWVLPVPVEELGLALNDLRSPMGVRGWARQADDERADEGAFVYFTPRDLPLDPTIAGFPSPLMGPSPVHGGDRLLVELQPGAGGPGELPPELLILHHTNVLADRIELVSLAEADNTYEQGDVAVESSDATLLAGEGETATSTFEVTNHGPGPLADVSLTIQLTLLGATVSGSSVTAGSGTCSGPDANFEIQCGLGTLAENGTALVTVSLDVASPGTIALLGQVSTGLGCPAPAHNDADQVVIYVEAAPEAGGPRKGCGCHNTSPRGTFFLLPLILIGLYGRRFFRRQ